jgi:hypothetical protein
MLFLWRGEGPVKTQRILADEQLGPEYALNVRLVLGERREVITFALNLGAYIAGRWRAVYRVDNYHGFLHEQRLWLTRRPFPLQGYDGWSARELFAHFRTFIVENASRFKAYQEAALRGE